MRLSGTRPELTASSAAGLAMLLGLFSAACGDAASTSTAAGGASSASSSATSSGSTGGKSGAGGATASSGNSSGGASSSTGGQGGQGGQGGALGLVDLRTAGDYVILAKSGISTVPMSVITGDLGVSPVAATYITGFSLKMDPSNVFSTSTQVTGKVFASDYAPPTPSNLTTAVLDMQTAFTDAAGRAPGVTELGAGDIGGATIAPGVYSWSTGLLVPKDVTLQGGANGVWIFQIAKSLTISDATHVVLAGGALAKHVFWQVSGAASLGTTSHLEGVLMSQTSITLKTGASINGRLFAQTSVDIDSSTVVQP